MDGRADVRRVRHEVRDRLDGEMLPIQLKHAVDIESGRDTAGEGFPGGEGGSRLQVAFGYERAVEKNNERIVHGAKW